MLVLGLREERFEPGDVIYAEGAHGDRMFIVESGEVACESAARGVTVRRRAGYGCR